MALALGYKSRRRMLEDLTFREYLEWIETYKQQPFGVLRDELNHLRVAQAAWAFLLGRVPEISELQYQVVDQIKAEMESQMVHDYLATAEPISLGPAKGSDENG